MNHTNTRTSQAGFSLVELMVVVAIIGVLAAIAVPNVNKYIAKSRQSEAKTNLASIYTSEKAFFAEYNGYFGVFQVIGYSPEGKLRYNTGFAAAGAVPASYTGATAGQTNTTAYCGTGTVVGATSRCVVLTGNGIATPIAAAGTITNGAGVNSFLITATAKLVNTQDDTWTMTDAKVLTNTVNGIN